MLRTYVKYIRVVCWSVDYICARGCPGCELVMRQRNRFRCSRCTGIAASKVVVFFYIFFFLLQKGARKHEIKFGQRKSQDKKTWVVHVPPNIVLSPARTTLVQFRNFPLLPRLWLLMVASTVHGQTLCLPITMMNWVYPSGRKPSLRCQLLWSHKHQLSWAPFDAHEKSWIPGLHGALLLLLQATWMDLDDSEHTCVGRMFPWEAPGNCLENEGIYNPSNEPVPLCKRWPTFTSCIGTYLSIPVSIFTLWYVKIWNGTLGLRVKEMK